MIGGWKMILMIQIIAFLKKLEKDKAYLETLICIKIIKTIKTKMDILEKLQLSNKYKF